MKCLSTTHTPTFNYIRSTSSVTLDLWEMGFNDIPNNYQSVLDDVQHNDQTTRSTSSVTSGLWEIGLDNVQHDNGIVQHGRSTQSVITNLWEGDCNLWLAPTQQRSHNSDPAGFNDQDSYGPATTQQQSHNIDPEVFETTTMSKTNPNFPRQHQDL